MYAIVPAAGSGIRMGELSSKRAKVLLPLHGELTILELSLRALYDSGMLEGLAIACRGEDIQEIEAVCERLVPGLDCLVVCGGDSRQDSVYRALKAVKNKTSHVMIHDAARPFCKPEHIQQTAGRCLETGACILAVPVKATLKRAENSVIQSTVPRQCIWEAQTPQAFSYELILQAYEKAIEDGYTGTDDSELVERLGHKVSIIEGSDSNIKITTPHDLAYARQVLAGG